MHLTMSMQNSAHEIPIYRSLMLNSVGVPPTFLRISSSFSTLLLLFPLPIQEERFREKFHLYSPPRLFFFFFFPPLRAKIISTNEERERERELFIDAAHPMKLSVLSFLNNRESTALNAVKND